MITGEAQPVRRPILVARFLVSVATRILPGGSRRERYRQEFLAELYGMPPGRQTAHALQIAASSWSLRAAMSHSRQEGKTMLTTLRSKPLLCLFNIRHHWQTMSTTDGERYHRCSKCGKDRMDYPWGLHPKGHNTIGA
jgi:hypothetical protein